MPTIRELREAKGWTQQELATKASVSIHTVGALEAGRPVQKTTIILIAQTLGVNPNEITGVNVVNRVGKVKN